MSFERNPVTAMIGIATSSARLSTEVSHGPRSGLRQKVDLKGPGGLVMASTGRGGTAAQ
jgi:hypothetical protein